MKKIILIICLLPIFAFSQVSYKIIADSTILKSISTNSNELVIRNSTKDTTTSVLYNNGNGVTQFKKVRVIGLNDSTYVVKIGTLVVGDTIKIHGQQSLGGTVTSVATDVTLTGGPIISSGTLKVDTTIISTKNYALNIGNNKATFSALNDSITAVRSIRKVDTIYKNTGGDSIVYTINGLRRAIIDRQNTGTVTSIATGVGLSGGTITGSGTIVADTSGTLVTKTFLTSSLSGISDGSNTYAGNGLTKYVDTIKLGGRTTQSQTIVSVGSPINNPIGGVATIWTDTPTRPTVSIECISDDFSFLTGYECVNFNTLDIEAAQIGSFDYNSSSDLDDNKLMFLNNNGSKETYLIGLPTDDNADQIVVRDSATNRLYIANSQRLVEKYGVTSVGTGVGLSGGTITGSGTIVADTSGTLVTKTFLTSSLSGISGGGGSSAISSLTAATATNNILNTNYKQRWSWNTLAGDTALALNSSSTAAASNLNTLLAVTQSGTSSSVTQSTFGIKVSNTKVSTQGMNYALYAESSGSGGALAYGQYNPAVYAKGVEAPIIMDNYSSTGGNYIDYRLGGTEQGYVGFNYSGSSNYFYFMNKLPKPIIIGTNNTNWLYVGNYSGASQLGIGGVPTCPFEVSGTAVSSRIMKVHSGFIENDYAGDIAYVHTRGGNFGTIGVNSSGNFIIGINGGGTGTQIAIHATRDNVGMGTVTPVASAKLELSSTTQGFLPPRMTTTQRDAISSPATGLMIYDTTVNKVSVYNGSIWKYLQYE